MLMANLNHRVFEEESRSFPDISSNEALHETVQKHFVSYTAPVKECLDSRQTETYAGSCRISVAVAAFAS